MRTTLVVVADIGRFKAFKLEDNQLNRTPRLELVEEFDNAAAHAKLVDKVTDWSGRFPRAESRSHTTNAMSDGERHNLELEIRKRLVRQLAQRLNKLDRSHEAQRWMLAASREMNHLLLEELDPQLRAKIAINIAADLTKSETADILRHF
jgi:hypothetical protein